MTDDELKGVGKEQADKVYSALQFAALYERGLYLDALRSSGLFGPLKIKRIRQIGKHDAHYEMELEDGTSIPLGTSAEIQNYTKVSQRVADYCKLPWPLMKKADWWPYYQSIIWAADQPEDTGNTPREIITGWLLSFLAVNLKSHKVHTEVTVEAIASFDEAQNYGLEYTPPLIREGNMITLRPGDIAKHVTLLLGQATTESKIREMLAIIGYTKRRPTKREGGELHQTKRFAWTGPIPHGD